ncbi:MAG: TIM44-like domain-containing protein [Desulfovibrionaceae bacterium]|nr:TIM44-like domain-containing protein [Desulfovibrionaceae bacterium]
MIIVALLLAAALGAVFGQAFLGLPAAEARAWSTDPGPDRAQTPAGLRDAVPGPEGGPSAEGGWGRNSPNLTRGLMIGLLAAVAVYILFRVFGAGRNPPGRGGRPASGGPDSTGPDSGPAGPGGPGPGPGKKARPDRFDHARAMWDALGSKPGAEKARPGPGPKTGASKGFDPGEFLEGAKAAYVRIRQAWDERNWEDAADFALPEAVERMRRLSGGQDKASKTEIILLEARLMELKEGQTETEAVVFYDATLGRSGEQPGQNREVWRFVRDPGDPASTWKLRDMEPVN